MFDGQPYREELLRRLDSIQRVLDASASAAPMSIDRELRGFIILLLFASYENLITSLCRGLLETASSLRVSNRRMRRGFRQFAIHSHLKSIKGSISEGRIWKEAGPKLLDCAFNSRLCTIDSNLFPNDGSYMKSSQVCVFCDIFELGDPGPILREVWGSLDAIVTERNGIAHGRLTPEEVGRRYSHADIKTLVALWQERWTEFINHVESRASCRAFFRHER